MLLDAPYNGFARLAIAARGPEIIYVLPQDDLPALRDVMRQASEVWNGPNALLAPVDEQGQVSDLALAGMNARRFDLCVLHPSLSDAQRQGTRVLTGIKVSFEHFSEGELGALMMVPTQPGAEAGAVQHLSVPVADQESDRLVTEAVWGAIPSGDRAYWDRQFVLREVSRTTEVSSTLLGSQISKQPLSPLRLGRVGMDLIRWRSPDDWRALVVFSSPTFDDLVRFWNWRACAYSPTGSEAFPVIGALPRHLKEGGALLRDWAIPRDGWYRDPEILVFADQDVRPEVRGILEAVGLHYTEPERISRGFSQSRPQAEQGRFAFVNRVPEPGAGIVRGSAVTAPVEFRSGRAVATLSLPPYRGLRASAPVRLTALNVPTFLPQGPASARRILRRHDAFDLDGPTVFVGAGAEPIDFPVAVPRRHEELQDCTADLGVTARATDKSRYCDALLERMPDETAIDALSTSQAVALLNQLVPTQREKLAQRLVKEARAHGEVTTDALLNGLKKIGTFLELPAKQIDGLTDGDQLVRKKDVLRVIEPLVDAGFVVRGRQFRCPVCLITDFFSLADLAEHVVCRACRVRSLLPVRQGADESPTSYRLDGLMARVMDQDVLPVLLTRRLAHQTFGADGARVATWTGLEFTTHGLSVDVDLLVARKDLLVCFECKTNGATLSNGQLEKQLDLCSTLKARPGLACLSGNFPAELAAQVEALDGFVYENQTLVRAE